MKETQINCCLSYPNLLFLLKKLFHQKILKLCAQLWKKFKNLSLQVKWSVRHLFHIIDKFFQSSICSKTKDLILAIKSIILKEKIRTCLIWFKKLCKYCRKMEAKMHILTLNTWFQLMRAACFENTLCFKMIFLILFVFTI